MMGMMHVSTSFHMVFISISLKFLLSARLNIVCSAASFLPLSYACGLPLCLYF